jgi:cyclic pyranopterin phosphate synthase
MSFRDALGRPLADLRVSITDRCNFRCSYCMPLDHYEWLEREEILTFEETERLVRVFVDLGVESVRITGGEPLVRRDAEILVEKLARVPGLTDLSLTTNGALLEQKAAALARAGLRRVNVSLDTLSHETFRKLTKRDDLDRVLRGLGAAREAGFRPIKINTVVVRGLNDGEILDLVDFSRANGFTVRFIEYMDVGNANGWTLEGTVPRAEILGIVRSRYPLVEKGRPDGRAPAEAFAFADGAGEIGVVGSVTGPFCGTCSRARLTAEGRLVTCLFASEGFDLKGLLRDGASDGEIRDAVLRIWSGRRDRYSEERWERIHSGAAYRASDHRKIEMIRLGG